MADISAQIRAIQQASRGEDVRDAIVNALNAINDGAIDQQAVTNAINALDVASTGGNGKYIKSISESNGKISAVEDALDTQATQNSAKPITSGAVYSLKSTLESNFQAGVDDIYDAVVAKGSTPASKSLSDVIQGIEDISTGGGSGITPVTEIFLNGGDGDTLVLNRNKDVSGLIVPEEAQAFSQYAYHEKTTYSGYRNSDTPSATSLTLTESILLESEQTFKSRFPEATSMEYNGNIYGNTSLITDLNLQLLCDASAGGNSTVTLSDSIENYSLIFLQGIYQTQKSSNYNTTKVYINPSLNTQYWAGMKDRNSSYDCFVTFTSNTQATLTGNNQVMIYGMPKSVAQGST